MGYAPFVSRSLSPSGLVVVTAGGCGQQVVDNLRGRSEDVLSGFLLNQGLDFRSYHSTDWCSMIVVVSTKLEQVAWSLYNGGFAVVSLKKSPGKKQTLPIIARTLFLSILKYFIRMQAVKKHILFKKKSVDGRVVTLLQFLN